ncbi:hypothetical protein SAY87_031643 [Trapa incisa]|uniref:DYW domain-containing protein n=2 Tax=Trapa TaxID=22665 RepID=A0AAN7LZV0_TRANT|nr:hypothetical protein SAY87_031643 [Trapa incisa]KAK4795594.1 hypothetical protein SAY86_027920 [Trapa natans]
MDALCLSVSPSSAPSPQALLHSFNSPWELKQLHAHLIKSSVPLSSLPLPRVAAVCGPSPAGFPYAHRILTIVQGPASTTSLWNSCLKALAEGDSPSDAILLFYRLRDLDVLPDTFTCSFVLKACTKLLDLENGRIIHGYVEKLGLRWNLFLENMIVNLYASCGEMGDAEKLFDSMPKRDTVTWNTMITQSLKRGYTDKAHSYFTRMPERSVRSWTAMISGLAQCGKHEEALQLFRKMKGTDLRPNEVTVVAVLAACAAVGSLDLGREIHEFSDKSGFTKNTHISNTLVDMYVKCGCLEEALKVFNAMEERTIVSWSAMVYGLAMHGKGQEALSLFDQMVRMGVRPNGVTFVGLLHACSHMGLVDQGREFFAEMIRDYGMNPNIEHYGCIVDLLSRAGHLKEAREFIKNMPMEPNEVVWGAFLGGCAVHKNIELAEEATEHLSQLDPHNDGYYIVLSNIYANAKRWEDVARVRRLMRSRGVKKTPGCSTITIDGEVHRFVAGDLGHDGAEEMSQRWEVLLGKMKSRGYVPNTSVVLLDIEESEKEKFLYRHSEKLALVYGLINTRAGTTITIMKNLRVCQDCHEALKVASEVTSREIVVRDRNRFHLFKDGICSCGDYW